MSRAEVLKEVLRLCADCYRQNGRALPWRRDADPYHVFLSEIMLQQTRVEAVIPYYEKFLALFPTVKDLALAEEQVVLKAWEGLGYYSRARNLLRAAKTVAEEYGGLFPASFEGLLSLPGVGKYTAGAIASISFGLPKSAVDGNALRIYTRLFADGTNAADERFKAKVTAELDGAYPSGEEAGAATQGLMEVGQCYCLPNGAPRCEGCPLRSLCAVGQGEDYRLYPQKEKKKSRRTERLTVLLLTDGERFALRRRPDVGLLAGLWEFPNEGGSLTEEEAVTAARALGFRASGAIAAIDAKHIFTHIEWHMTSYLLPFEGEIPQGFSLASYVQMKENYPIASAFRAFLDYINEHRK